MMAKTKDELMTSAMDEAQKIMGQAKSRLREVFEGIYNSAYKRGWDDAIEELSKMVSADDAKAYLDRDDLVNTLMEHKKSFDLRDRNGDYGMGFSEAIKVVAMTYPVYVTKQR